jgi:hypothetical protein
MHYLSSYRFGDETNHILDNKFHINNADEGVVKFLLNDRTFSFKQNCSLDCLLQKGNESKLKEVLLLHFERIKYYTMMCKGNFIITSNKTLYNKTLFNNAEVRNFNMYLVDEKLLPKNVLILGHSNRNSFRTPFVACPLIDKNAEKSENVYPHYYSIFRRKSQRIFARQRKKNCKKNKNGCDPCHKHGITPEKFTSLYRGWCQRDR